MYLDSRVFAVTIALAVFGCEEKRADDDGSDVTSVGGAPGIVLVVSVYRWS